MAFPLGSLTAALSLSWVLGVPETYLPPSPSSFFQGMQKRALQHILSQWHLRAWGPEPPSSSMETMLALQPWGNSPRGEAWLGLGTSGGPLEKVRGWSRVEMGGVPGFTPTHSFQGPSPSWRPSWWVFCGQPGGTTGTVPSSLAGAGPADPECSEAVPPYPPEAVGTPPPHPSLAFPAAACGVCISGGSLLTTQSPWSPESRPFNFSCPPALSCCEGGSRGRTGCSVFLSRCSPTEQGLRRDCLHPNTCFSCLWPCDLGQVT